MTKEALKLALEALENWLEFDPENFGEVDNKALTAIKEALAQPEQAPMNYYRADAKGNLERIDIHSAQPEQEPVAWHTEPFKPDWDTQAVLVEEQQRMAQRICELEAQRTWVGLTDDEEIFAISNTMPYADRFEFARAIEAKLKEKNVQR